MAKVTKFYKAFLYSFTIQLLLNNFKRNHVLMLSWIFLFSLVTGNFGRYLGIPYLFLDPEYLNQTNFFTFFIMGMMISGYSTGFNITCYISDGHRFSFVGALPNPFRKFCLNNSVLPITFLVTYIFKIVHFQLNNQYASAWNVILYILGLIGGYVFMWGLFNLYFHFTQKDVFKYVVCRVDDKIKNNIGITRATAMNKLDIAMKQQVRVDNYFYSLFKIKKIDPSEKDFYDKRTILQVFDQNQFNLVVIELLIFALVIILGIFKDYPAFQFPAAASLLIFLTILVMISGAFSFWFGNWSLTVTVLLFVSINYMVGEKWFTNSYFAFGLDYNTPPVEYSIPKLNSLNDSVNIVQSKAQTISILENWKKKFGKTRAPKIVFICVSGGGKRASIWTFAALQRADSLTHGNLMKQSILITGASGGLIGASYFRELILRSQKDKNIRPYSAKYITNISNDNLNPLFFSLLANDLFVGLNKFEFAGKTYPRDRGYTFEQQLNIDTDGFMDKTLLDYKEPETSATIPMIIFSPTIVNDGRKLYISSQNVSYLNSEILNFPLYQNSKLSGVDFQKLFVNHDSEQLRFLSALRMSATFPYITPSTTLPSTPPIQIVDAGLSDNFGISDAVRFVYVMRDWIANNTAGIIIVSIRDSPKLNHISEAESSSIVSSIMQPISSVYNNLENFQDISNDNQIGFAKTWFDGPIDRIDIQYLLTDDEPSNRDSLGLNTSRASLSWRLTRGEKEGLIETLDSPPNQQSFERLKRLLK